MMACNLRCRDMGFHMILLLSLLHRNSTNSLLKVKCQVFHVYIGVMSLSQVSPSTQPETYVSTGHASTGSPPVTLPDLLNLVVTRIPSKWRAFAIMLELPNLDFDTYPIHDAKECFVRVLSEWKKIGQPQYSWDTVLNILEMPFMSEQRLSMEIRSKLTLKRYFSTSFYPPLSCPSTSIEAVDLPVT